jgi:putative MATE family efflux protein
MTHSHKQILQLWIPASLEAVFQMTLGLVDQVIIGQLGDTAVAAAALANQILFLLTLVLGALGTAGAILIARAHGRGDHGGVQRTIGACVQIGLLVSLPLAGLLIAIPQPMLRLLGADAQISESGQTFLRLMLLALPAIVLGAVAVGALRSRGDSRTPMLVTLGALAINTLLGFLLVGGAGPLPALGIAGAGLATLIAQAARLAALLWVLRRRELWRPADLLRHRPAGALVRELAQLAAPLSLSLILWSAGGLCYTILCAHLGRTAIVANQIVIAVENVFVMCASGLGVAGLTIVGNRLGAGDLAQTLARSRELIAVGLKVSVGMALAVLAARWAVPSLYPQVSDQALALAVLGLAINALTQPAKVLNMVIGDGVLRAGGDTRFLVVTTVVSIYAVGVPLAVVLSQGWPLGLLGILVAKAAEELARTALYVVRYRTPRWRHRLSPSPGGS